MRSRWQVSGAAMVVCGLVALTGVSTALAQKPKAPAGKGKAPSAAAAPMNDKQKKEYAKKHYKEGEKLFKDGKFKEAFNEYKLADDALPVAASKYKMAVCLDKTG